MGYQTFSFKCSSLAVTHFIEYYTISGLRDAVKTEGRIVAKVKREKDDKYPQTTYDKHKSRASPFSRCVVWKKTRRQRHLQHV